MTDYRLSEYQSVPGHVGFTDKMIRYEKRSCPESRERGCSIDSGQNW